jgi:hypothetical protein
MSGADIINEIVLTGAVMTGLTAIAVLIRGTFRLFRKASHLLDDLIGEEARPGVEARAGLTERISRIEHELNPNSGGSLRDSIDRIESMLANVAVTADEALDASRTAKAERSEILKALLDDRADFSRRLGIEPTPAPYSRFISRKEDAPK